MIAITLPWPARALHPNARVHWSARARATKQARADAGWAAKAAGLRSRDPDIPRNLKVTAIFFPPNRRKHDIDGCMASCKAFFDGIADVIGIDDSKWQFGAPRKESIVKGGLVRIELEAVSEDWVATEAVKWRNERRVKHIAEVVEATVGARK